MEENLSTSDDASRPALLQHCNTVLYFEVIID